MVRRPTLHRVVPLLAAACCLAGAACTASTTGTTTQDAGTTPVARYPYAVPPGFPVPPVPVDNPVTDAKVLLGRHLFYDVRLSINSTTSCATCHHQDKAFTDARPTALGATGEHTPRGSMALMNVAYAASLGWANPLLQTLEQQLLVPLFGTHPVEMGMAGREDQLLQLFETDPTYARLFPQAFPGDTAPFTLHRMAQAIASFERTLISGTSPWDRFAAGGAPDAVTVLARRGAEQFFSERFECYHCHGGFLFTDNGGAQGAAAERPFHNNGLYNVDGAGGYPPDNVGVFEISGNALDMGRFKAPSLRNIAVTAPYMHDGTLATLDDVLDHYAQGGQVQDGGVHHGRDNPLKDSLVRGIEMTPEERANLLAFLHALTDDAFLTNPAFGNPWPPGP